MNLETLKYFQYVAKYKNITRAAKQLFVSQSTLSRNIMALEEELDVKLFERTGKQLSLTDAGRVFMQECNLLIKHMESIAYKVRIAHQGTSGFLRVTTPGNLCDTLNDSFHLIQKKYPSLNLVVESSDFNEIASSLEYGVYDIGFSYEFATPYSNDLGCIPIGTDDFSLAVPKNFFENPTTDSLPEIVKSLPFVMPAFAEPPFMKLLIHRLQLCAGISKLNIVHVNTPESVMLEINLGLGYGVIPASLKSKNAYENISYLNIEDVPTEETIVMLYKKGEQSDLVKAFIEIVRTL